MFLINFRGIVILSEAKDPYSSENEYRVGVLRFAQDDTIIATS